MCLEEFSAKPYLKSWRIPLELIQHLLVIALLYLIRADLPFHRLQLTQMEKPLQRRILCVFGVSVFLLLTIGFVLWKQFGSFAAARAFVRGEAVVIIPAEI